MKGACITHGDEKMNTKFLLESLKGRENEEGLGIDGRIIGLLKWTLRKYCWKGC
jgi:hypothetical protein